jgi:hypothetical protein
VTLLFNSFNCCPSEITIKSLVQSQLQALHPLEHSGGVPVSVVEKQPEDCIAWPSTRPHPSLDN